MYNPPNQVAQDRASKALVYYFRLIWERNGITWTSDNESEVRGIVEDILLAAKRSS